MTLSLRPHRFVSHDSRVVDAELGSLSVPMNRAAPTRGNVELAFVRLPSIAARPGPPILFLSGGPGISGIRAARGRLFTLFEALRAVGDVILLDQRGSGASRPSLACAEPLTLPFARAFSRDEVLRAAIASTRRCAERLAHGGVDLAAFNTSESAADVADLVRALGVEKVSLLGWSYGTHLAFAVMRRFEALVARAVLAGPEGPDQTYKLPSRIQLQLEMIAHRARLQNGDTPDLLDTMPYVLHSVADAPRQIKWSTGEPKKLVIGRFDLEWMTAEGVADTRMLARLPRWYARMARGDYDEIARDVHLRAYCEELRTGLNRSLVRICMDCASGASPERWQRIQTEAGTALLGRTVDFPFPEICEAVGAPDLGDAFRAPLHSNIEVLFVTGTLDARTPSENVADLAPGLPNHAHLIVEDVGHTDLLFPSSVQRSIARYLASGELDSDRARADQPFRFAHSQPVLLYDGDCGFCRRQVERLHARVGDAVAFQPFQHATDRAGIPESNLSRAIHLIDADGRVSSGAEAVFRTLAAGKGRSAWLWMYRRVPGFAPIAELGYRWVARHRGRLSR
jgi:pimeloyl-ACP methyl ester carboxylesterase/predicted DCC family thiol-disulfide oxidoreductase YuxK